MLEGNRGGWWLRRPETPGWPVTVFRSERLVAVSRGNYRERPQGSRSSRECARLTRNYKEQSVRKSEWNRFLVALPNAAGMRAGATISHLQKTGMSGCYSRAKFHNSISSARWPYILSWRPTLGQPGSADKTRHETDKARWNYSTNLASHRGLISSAHHRCCHWVSMEKSTEVRLNRDNTWKGQ